MLTTKGALLTLGFIKPQADTLWHILINVSSAPVVPGIWMEPQSAFWMEANSSWVMYLAPLLSNLKGVEMDYGQMSG